MKLIQKMTGYNRPARQIPTTTTTSAPSDARPAWEGQNVWKTFKEAVEQDKWGKYS